MYIRSIALTDADFAGDDAYLGGIPAIRALGTLDLSRAPVTFLAGENCTGKSTIL